MKHNTFWKSAAAGLGALTLAFATQAQDLTTPCPNRVISWNLDDWSTVQPTDLAGLAPAVNWVDTWLNDIRIGLPDNQGATTTLNLGRGSFNTWHIQGNHPGLDANGTANREVLNGYLNSGPAGWNPSITNTWVSLTNIPYTQYDVVVYFNADASGRHGSIDNGSKTYYFSTVGSAARSGANALFLPTTETNSSVFPPADFAFFPGMTSANAIFTEYPKSGNDQWLGICGFQVIESSNVYVLYGPSPTAQVVPVGQPASFKVMAGGLNPAYQWRHDGTNIANATNAAFAIASTVVGQDGNYDVVVNNSFSSVTSLVATLTFYSPKALDWAGNSSTWDTADTTAWTADNGATTIAYTETDNVLFGFRGSAASYVSLSGTRAPTSITVSNASYTLASGDIGGNGSLSVINNGTLILDTTDTSTGPVTIGAGSVLQVGNGGTTGVLGSGPLTNNGGLVYNHSDDEAYGYPVYGTGSVTNLGASGRVTFGNTINGTYLVQAGTGEVLLQGDNKLTGGVVVSAGTMMARSAGALGGAPVLVGGGELQLFFGFDYAGSALTLAGGTLHGGISGSQVFEGTVTLTADAIINVDGGSSLTLSNAAGIAGNGFILTKTGDGILWMNGISGSGAVTVSGGSLGGTGTIGGPVTVQSGGTLVPGAPASVGTLTISSGLTIEGNLSVEVDKSLAQSNDVVAVSGTLANTGTGIVTVTNLGAVLAAGDKFKLFSKAVVGGETMTISGGDVVWLNHLAVDGSIQVAPPTVPQPVITSVVLADATSLVFSGNNGTAGSAYTVLSSTNAALPLSDWTVEASGNFDASGNFSVTNAISAGVPQKFYRLQLP